MYDILIKNGTIYDGDGGKPYAGSVAISGDQIAAVGALKAVTDSSQAINRASEMAGDVRFAAGMMATDLGNLYREKGQVGKAITVHQGLLQRPRLTRLEHAHVLLCLGLDYKRGGFVDRGIRWDCRQRNGKSVLATAACRSI